MHIEQNRYRVNIHKVNITILSIAHRLIFTNHKIIPNKI